jgi:site-specific DNA-methyltransferase (adenine-specific)
MLHLGDCLEVMPRIPDGSVDAVITDPPYFLPVNSYVGKRGEGYAKRTLADSSVLRGYFERVFVELSRLLKPNGTYYVFCDAQSYPIFYQVMYPYTKYVRLLIWDKVVSYNGYTWRHQHELIAWGELDESERIPTGDGDILKCRGVLQKDRLHPAQKPVELLSRLIDKNVPASGVVLDPYMGSGTTGVACKETGRNFIGIEMEPQYYEIAKRRIEAAHDAG